MDTLQKYKNKKCEEEYKKHSYWIKGKKKNLRMNAKLSNFIQEYVGRLFQCKVNED